jgi:murein DD-endopeptidase MepM/ murein hydrolase activator NlpD
MKVVLMLLKLLAVSIFLSASLFSANKQKLEKINTKLTKYNSELAGVSSRLQKEEQDLKEMEKELIKLEKEIYKGKSKFLKEKKELEKVSKDKDVILKQQNAVRKMAVDTSAKLISLSIVLEEGQVANLDSIILNEAFKLLFKKNSEDLHKITESISKRQEVIDKLHGVVGKLEDGISTVEKKRKKLLKKKKDHAYRVNRLKKDKENYFRRIKEIKKTQNRIREEIEKSRRQAEEKRKKEQKKTTQKPKGGGSHGGGTTKDYGDSYKKELVRKYRGKKTISPINNYTVTKSFGNYKDPIYKIKLFNSYVSLRPSRPKSKVRSIFNGRISIVKDDNILGKFIVIEHFNGYQTVYAHLSDFAPNIKKGRKVKKGSIIGRVTDELYFEVMKGAYHINPLQVIK